MSVLYNVYNGEKTPGKRKELFSTARLEKRRCWQEVVDKSKKSDNIVYREWYNYPKWLLVDHEANW